MIRDKKDLNNYLIADKCKIKGKGFFYKIKDVIIPDYSGNDILQKYIKALRYTEYAFNTRNYFLLFYWGRVLRKISHITGFQIPLNTIGPGLTLFHWGTIIINARVRIGNNLTIHPNVIIGQKIANGGCPKIGNNCYICSGVIILGDITIGDNVKIAHNTIIRKNVPSNCVVAGYPAHIIKLNGERVNLPL